MILVPHRWIRAAFALGAVASSTFASAQYPSFQTNLFSNIGIATFGVSGGNDCWGYVSPSGREYAIVGLREKVAFVEVTNPNAPIYFASIPHTSSTWGDIKVYQDVAYAVTEASGTGVQVIDMSNIDNHVVTLVRTLASPGRTHNLAMDAVNGFLYTCGSRDGTGTTMCFSLANKTNPVRVGPNSFTADYQHDGTIRTFTSGPYAGKQIWFGFSEGRGVDVYDFTNKLAPTKIKTIIYPGTQYCHQGWLSADAKYLYVDDELDEGNGGQPTTRTLVFDVENLQNAVYVTSFTSGAPAIDHNQYWADGFLFQANYRSGLRIFDAANPLAPVQVGWFDTYPANDNASFDGAWSNYPYFPSGNVVVSDINRGFFLVDVLEATTRNVAPAEVMVIEGKGESAGIVELSESDDDWLIIHSMPFSKGRDLCALTFAATAYDTSPLKIRLMVESLVEDRGIEQTVALRNWSTGAWEQVDRSVLNGPETTLTITPLGNLTRFVNPTTRRIEGRLGYGFRNGRSNSTTVAVDMVKLRVTR